MRQNQKKSKRGVGRRAPQPNSLPMRNLQLELIPSYPKQVVFEAWLPATPVKFSTTVTTGSIAGTSAVSINNISAFATRFASTFVEYRIIKANFRVRLFSSINPGVLQMWIDELSTTAPTLNEARERATLIVSASSNNRIPAQKWVNADFNDLQYRATSTSFTAATFKIYTDNAIFGSSIVATDYLEVEPEFLVQFRGLQGV